MDELKSDYFRIEMEEHSKGKGKGPKLKSDYFRIEIEFDKDIVYAHESAKIRLF